MRPRHDLVEIFSTFLQLDSDRVLGWIWDRRLQRHMTQHLTGVSSQSEQIWALYWHQQWQARSHPLAETHLAAYLQETCYWAAWKIARNQRQLNDLADLFQVAIARLPKLLGHFNADYHDTLKPYAQIVFENSLKDWLNVQEQIAICSDWALLDRTSRKRLVTALQWAGLTPTPIAQTVLAWECFQELAPHVGEASPKGNRRSLSRPDPAIWPAIAQAYNQERLTQVASTASPATPEHIEQWLLTAAQALRQWSKPRIVALDAPKPGQEDSPLLESLADPSRSPLDELIDHEAERIRQQQQRDLQAVLIQALDRLTQPETDLLDAYYRDDRTQTQIAEKLGIQQYQVSRQLDRIRRSLLKKIVAWSQTELHISPSPSVVESMNQSLDVWLHTILRKPSP